MPVKSCKKGTNMHCNISFILNLLHLQNRNFTKKRIRISGLVYVFDWPRKFLCVIQDILDSLRSIPMTCQLYYG